MTPEEEQAVRGRQRVRARLTAILLVAMVVLFFAITLAKLAGQHA